MEERKLNEKESLELIAQMIQNSKKNLQVGSGNQFILWGWLGAITSLAVMSMLMWTKNPMWNWLWFAIPVIGWPVMMWQMQKERNRVVTFTDKVMIATWKTIGSIGIFSILLMAYIAHNSQLIIPGTILLVGVGSAITGSVLDNKRIQSWVSCTFGFAIIVSLRIAFDGTNPIWNHITFFIAFMGMLVIPGYILNKEAKRHVQGA